MKVYKHGNKYQITYRISGYDKTFTESFGTEAEAKLRAAEVEYEKARGTLKPPSKVKKQPRLTVQEYLDNYVANYGCSHWGDSYYASSVSRIKNYITPYLGHFLLRDLDAQVLTQFYNSLLTVPAVVLPGHKDTGKTVSLSVIEKIQSLMSSACKQAVSWGCIEKNPAEGATYPTQEKKRSSVWDLETAKRAADLCDDDNLRIVILLAVACSMRVGEILGLSWANVNLSESDIKNKTARLAVTQELKRCDKVALAKTKSDERGKVYFTFPAAKPDCKTALVLKQPKTESSERTIYLPATLAKMLLEHKAKQEKQKEDLLGEYQDYDLVIAQANGRPVETRLIDRALKELIEKHGLPEVVFHSTRHLSTSEKLKASGGDIKAVQGDTGHSQSRMVTDVYAEVFDDDRKRLASKMDTVLFSASNSETEPDIRAAMRKLQASSPEKQKAILALIDTL